MYSFLLAPRISNHSLWDNKDPLPSPILIQDAIGRRAKILLNLKIDGSEVAKKAEAYVKEGAALAVPIETSDEDSEDFKKPSAPIQRNREPCQWFYLAFF